MEDFWRDKNENEVRDFADIAEHNRFLERFCKDEEKKHRTLLLYKEERTKQSCTRET